MATKTENYGWQHGGPHTSAYLADRVETILCDLGAQTVLDAGCGNGALAGHLSRQGFTVTGVDGDPGGIAIARQNYSEVLFELSLFEDTSPGTFDAVVSTEVIEHLYSPHELVRFAYAALENGGHLVISTPYHGYLKNLALAITGKWDAHHTALWHGGHIKFWSRKTLTKLLFDNGFEVIDFVGAGRLPYLWKSMILVARKV